jgi:Cu-processing system permease protein
VKTILHILRYGLRDLVRNRWVLAYGLILAIACDLLLRLGGPTPRALLGLLNVVILLVPLATIVFGTIYWHGAREFNELLLAQPVSRSTLFHGLFAGLVIPLSVAFVAGVVIPLVLHRAIDSENITLVLMMLAAGVALTGVFGALAVLIGGLVEDRLKGVGVALVVWFLLSVVYDGVVLMLAVRFTDYPLEAALLALTFANPVDLARVLLVLQFDVSALMGYTGAVFNRVLGTALGASAAFIGLATWMLVPGLFALRTFRRRDF